MCLLLQQQTHLPNSLQNLKLIAMNATSFTAQHLLTPMTPMIVTKIDPDTTCIFIAVVHGMIQNGSKSCSADCHTDNGWKSQ